MTTLDTKDLITVTGGAATVARKADDQIEQALTKLSTDIKDLARGGTQDQNTQLTTLMTVALVSRFARR